MYQLLKTFSQTTWIRHVSCLNFPELQVTTKKKSILSANPVAKIIPVLQIWLQLLTKLCWTLGIFANASTVWLVPRWKFGLANRLCPSTASILPNFSISSTSSSWHLDYFGLILHSLEFLKLVQQSYTGDYIRTYLKKRTKQEKRRPLC